MEVVLPEYHLAAFNCPFCAAYAHMGWQYLYGTGGNAAGVTIAICSKCKKSSVWLDSSKKMIDPMRSGAPLPAKDMPEDVKEDYLEAADVFARSPRAAAALLRLSLQKLCVHLGEKGKNINEDIRELAHKNTLPHQLIKVADTVRLTGNNAVHPGEMAPEDIDLIASKMFLMLNLIVIKGITEPRELADLYSMTPAKARSTAEELDAKARGKNLSNDSSCEI